MRRAPTVSRRPAPLAALALALCAAGCKEEKSEASSRDPAQIGAAEEEPEGPCPRGAEQHTESTPGGPRVEMCRREGGTFHGPYRVTMPDGVVTAEGHYEDGEESGRWVFRHPGGELWKEGEYREGLRDGTWRIHDREGELLGTYRMRRGTGTRVRYWESGGRRESIEMRRGRRHGVTTWWRETGEKLMEAHYRDGDLHGTWTYWDREGVTRKIEEWREDRIESTTWYEDGEPLE